MKRIEELGISPAPWRVEGYTTADGESAHNVIDETGVIVGDFVLGAQNARLCAAAPEMYETLREAIVEYCHDCPGGGIGRCKREKCFVAKWREVIEKAGGEE